MLLWNLVLLVLAPCPDLLSQSPQEERGLLVSTDWLEEHLADDSLIILHYGMKTEFRKGHIPGARLIDIWDVLVTNKDGVRHELPEAQKLEQVLRSWGISNNSVIIISYQDGNAIPMAARLFYTLDYGGLGRQVSMLNGGFTAWKEEGKAVVKENLDQEKGNIEIGPRDELRISKDEVLASLDNRDLTIIDARPADRYNGTVEDDNDGRQGHIPGAINIPFFEVTQEGSSHMFKTKEALEQLFKENQVQDGSTIITYCGTGIWASPLYFTARMLSYQVRFYDGSFQEWQKDESLPLLTK